MIGRIRIKVCGITTIDQALMCAKLKVDYIGLNLAMGPRKITEARAAEIAGSIRSMETEPIGVFVNAELRQIQQIVDRTGMRWIQLHGDEDAGFLASLQGVSIIRSFAFPEYVRASDLQAAVSEACLPGVKCLLVDASDPNKRGGTGKRSNWKAAAQIAPLVRKKGILLGLAGGIGPENVGEAVDRVAPDLIDVNSAVELSPGVKSFDRLAEVIRILRQRESSR